MPALPLAAPEASATLGRRAGWGQCHRNAGSARRTDHHCCRALREERSSRSAQAGVRDKTEERKAAPPPGAHRPGCRGGAQLAWVSTVHVKAKARREAVGQLQRKPDGRGVGVEWQGAPYSSRCSGGLVDSLGVLSHGSAQGCVGLWCAKSRLTAVWVFISLTTHGAELLLTCLQSSVCLLYRSVYSDRLPISNWVIFLSNYNGSSSILQRGSLSAM